LGGRTPMPGYFTILASIFLHKIAFRGEQGSGQGSKHRIAHIAGRMRAAEVRGSCAAR
jgi:hypothetical protein